MIFEFTIQDRPGRYRAWRAYHLLAHPILVAFFIITLSSTLIGASLLITGSIPPTRMVVGFLAVDASVTGILLLLFTFATTYFPFILPPLNIRELMTDSDEVVNVLEASSFSLIAVLSQYVRHDNSQAILNGVTALLKTPAAKLFLRRLELDSEQFVSALQSEIGTGLTWPMLAQSMIQVASKFNHNLISIEHAVAALLLAPGIKTYLRQHDLRESDIYLTVWWLIELRRQAVQKSSWWKPAQLFSFIGVGQSWTSGFTPLVDRFVRIPAGNLWDQATPGREDQMKQIISSLARERQSNVLLVGSPGVGRLGLVRELAWRVQHSQAHPNLNGQRVVYLHLGELLAQGSSAASGLQIVSKVLTEMERAGNIIAVIDGLSRLIGGRVEGQPDLTSVLLPFLSSMKVRVLVVLSSADYHLNMRSNAELLHFFSVVQVPSATKSTTLQALIFSAPGTEQKTGLFLPYKTLRALVDETAGVLQDIPYPKRAFDILEEVLVIASAQHRDVITAEDVKDLISSKVGIPLGKLAAEEKNRLLHLEDLMHEHVVNQQPAIAALSRAMIRARVGVQTKTRPIGTFLFLGPTGVGKTETAKTLALSYFGSTEKMIRFDMSEFQDEESVMALIGNEKNPVGRLTKAVTDRPFAVLLLDEFEKAHLHVQQLFLQILDEGRLTDTRGFEVSFQHAIIIATSNAGSELIRKLTKSHGTETDFSKELREYILQKGIFRPELLNRFDGVITFTPLGPEHVSQIAELMLRNLNKRLDNEHGVTVAITSELIAYLMQRGYDPEFGVRPMMRAIQDSVEYVVAQQLLSGQAQPGQEIILSPNQLLNV